MKKLTVLLAFLLPIGLSAKFPWCSDFEATRDFEMKVYSEITVEKITETTIPIKKGSILSCCRGTPSLSVLFNLGREKYESSEKEFKSHLTWWGNGDLKEKPKTQSDPFASVGDQ